MKLKDFDSQDVFFILVGFGCMIALIICGFNFSYDVREKQCVKFYKENHYITKDCEKYTNKLKEIVEEIEQGSDNYV